MTIGKPNSRRLSTFESMVCLTTNTYSYNLIALPTFNTNPVESDQTFFSQLHNIYSDIEG